MVYNPDNEVEYFINLENKKVNKLKKIYQWLIISSVNSNNFSLTLKAGIPFLVLLGISDTKTLEELTGMIGTLVANIGQVVFGAVALVGLIRKIWFSMK